MNKGFILALLAVLLSLNVQAQDNKKTFHGFDGGMMIHTGYLCGNINALNYRAEGAPFGLGGVIRMHLGEHWRLGCEGYVSTLSQMGNDSYIRYGWGGIVGDFYWILGKFMPFAGLTLGGGANKNLLMMDGNKQSWAVLSNSYYINQGFFAVDPFIGCDFIVSKSFHLSIKVDYLNTVGKYYSQIPKGPRIYFGFLFYH